MLSFSVRRWVAGSVVLGLLCVCAPSWADDDPESLIRQGVLLRRRGDEAKAHGYFQRAYDIARTPRSAAQLGLSDLAIKHWLAAEIHITEALDAPDPWVESIKASLVKSRAGARAHLGKLEVEGAPPDAEVEATDRPRTRLPAGGALWVNPGAVHVRIQATGFEPSSQDVSVEAGGQARIRVTMARVEPPAPRTPPMQDQGVAGADGARSPGARRSPGTGRDNGAVRLSRHDEPKTDDRRALRITSIAVGGVGIAAGVTGFILRSMATTKLNAIDSDGKAGRPYNPSNGNYQTFDRAGVGLMIGGGVALGAGVIGYLLGRDRSSDGSSDRSAGEPAVAFRAGPNEAGVTIGGRF